MSNHASYAVRRKYRWQYDAEGIAFDGALESGRQLILKEGKK